MRKHSSHCSICGSEINIWLCSRKRSLTKLMRHYNLCFECAYWTNFIHNPTPGSTIISGGIYMFEPIDGIVDWRKLRMSNTVYVMDLYTKKVMGSTKCSLIGIIPKIFSKQLPDQYKFISKDTYLKIVNYQGTCCIAKGCWDRYSCWWYNAQIAEPKGPWNAIPKNHKIGDELCESFINKFTIYDIKH